MCVVGEINFWVYSGWLCATYCCQTRSQTQNWGSIFHQLSIAFTQNCSDQYIRVLRHFDKQESSLYSFLRAAAPNLSSLCLSGSQLNRPNCLFQLWNSHHLSIVSLNFHHPLPTLSQSFQTQLSPSSHLSLPQTIKLASQTPYIVLALISPNGSSLKTLTNNLHNLHWSPSTSQQPFGQQSPISER